MVTLVFAILLILKVRKEVLDKIPVVRNIANTLRDPNFPMPLKVVAVLLSLAYLAYPIDFIPDLAGLLFGIGFFDDIAMIGLIFILVEKLWKNQQKKSFPGKKSSKS